jgi:hypothetical protein
VGNDEAKDEAIQERNKKSTNGMIEILEERKKFGRN